MLIMDAIIDAAQCVKDHHKNQMIASDLIDALYASHKASILFVNLTNKTISGEADGLRYLRKILFPVPSLIHPVVLGH